MRVVIDTNVWISALLNPHGAPARLIRAFREGVFEVAASEPMLHEIEVVLRRPRIWRKYRPLVERLSTGGIKILSVQRFLDLLAEQTSPD